MKKLIKLSKDHYVIADDSEIKEEDAGSFFYHRKEGVVYIDQIKDSHCFSMDGMVDFYKGSLRKIISSTQPLKNVAALSLLEVERVIYGYDINKLATDYAESDFQSDIESDPLYLAGLYYGYVEGFRAHRELTLTDESVKSWNVEWVDNKLKLL